MIWLIRSTIFIDFAFVNLIFRFHLIFRDNAIQRKFVIQFFFNWNGKIRCFSSPVQHWTIYRYVSSTAWDLADTVNCIKKNSGFWTWAFIGRMIAKIKSFFSWLYKIVDFGIDLVKWAVKMETLLRKGTGPSRRNCCLQM